MRHFIGILTILALSLASSEAMAKTNTEKAQAFCASPVNAICAKVCKGWNKNAKSDGDVISACSGGGPPPPPRGRCCPLHGTRHSDKKVHSCPGGQHASGCKCVDDSEPVSGDIPWWTLLGLLMLNNALLLGGWFLIAWWRKSKSNTQKMLEELNAEIQSAKELTTKTSGELFELIQMLERRPLVDDDATAEELLARLKTRCVIPAMTTEGEEFQKDLLPK